ncbi:MAG: glycine betaine ABC transporter substrate-binding protein [Candidatus Acidiferrales bacterium]
MKRISVILLLLLAGCSGERERPIVTGSKNFTEQIVLAELLAQHIESKLGVRVERSANLGGTLICHQAVRAGEIDLYVEYTGTALTAVLHQQPSSDPAEVLKRVRAAYAQQFQLEVTEPLGFDNTFAIVVRGEDARRLGLRTISDLAAHALKFRAGFGYEFIERPDGYKGLARTYALDFRAAPRLMELGLLYRALEQKEVDVVAGSATDGIIAARDFVVLEDDKHYFPPYEAVPVVHRGTLERHPQLRTVLHGLAGRITAGEMRRLNYAVDGEHRDVKLVVREFLAAKGM